MGAETSQAVRIHLLGRFAVTVEGTASESAWRLRKAKTLVKLLALASGHRVHRDVLIEQLWPDIDPAAGMNNLHQTLHAARRVMGHERLVLQDDVIVLGDEGAIAVDVDAFDEASALALASGDATQLRTALDLWTGPLLPEDLYEDWAAPHRDRLDAVRVRLLAELAGALADEGRADEAVCLVEPVAAERPLDEHVHRALITALAAAGRRWDAAAAFDRLRDALQDAFGMEPERETRALYRRVFVGGAPHTGATAHNLPALSTSFVGRHRELIDLTGLLDRTRLLTLTGPGGAGKTRLAIELAHRQVGDGKRPDGVWLVELAGVAVGDGVPAAVATALGLPMPGGRSWITTPVDQLSTRNMLLVLDNCEHVLDAVVPLTTELLARCPDLVILATSREPLGLPGEVAWRVPSLELPAGELDDLPDQLGRLESVQLFVERARDASPAFALDNATAPHVADICRRLDGIPLALELAAARVPHLAVSQLAERLQDALTLLARRGPGQLDRQQTLAATLDWSHNLLTEGERVGFRRLAVFAGGFDLDAASAVLEVSDVVDVLGRLVDKSLVAAETIGDAARYRMLEVVRQYAEARLREADEVAPCRRRHRAWYAGEAARHDPDRGVPIVLEPPAWFDVEQDNLRAAFASAVDEDPCLALELATSTWRFLMSGGQLAEGLAWQSATLDACPEVTPLRARALFARGVLHVRRADLELVGAVGRELADVCRQLGGDDAEAAGLDHEAVFTLMAHDWAEAERLSAAALGRAGPGPSVTASTRHFAGVMALAQGEAEAARMQLREAAAALDLVPDAATPFFTTLTVCCVADDRGPLPLSVGEDTMLLGRRVGAAQARGHVAVAAAVAERIGGDVDRALELLDDAIKRFAGLGDTYGRAYALGQQGHALRWAGQLEAALRSFDEAEGLRRSLRDLRAIAMTLAGRSYVEARLGRAGRARAQVSEAIATMQRTGDLPGAAITVNIAGLIELELGHVDAALSLLDKAIAMGEGVGPMHAVGWQHLLVAHLRASVGDASGSARAVAEAATNFEVLGDRKGQKALQRACKEGAVSMGP